MTRRMVLTAVGVALTGAAELRAQAGSDSAAAKFYLDYNVPESPAFALLGATPSNVLRGTASKPLVVSLASDVARGDRIGAGVALDVAPYAYVGRFRNVKEYQDNAGKRFLANLVTSLATVQAPGDTGSTAFAAGLRLTFHDDHDLLQDTTLAAKVGALIVPRRISCRKIAGTNICQPGGATDTTEVDVSDAYAQARDSVSRTSGWAASAGAAFGGTLRGGVPRSDSLRQRTGHVWVAATRYLGGANELLAVGQWVRDTSRTSRLRAGVAYRMQSTTSSVAAELAYDTGAGGVLPGVNAELRLLQRVTLIAALVTDPPAGDGDRKRVRFRTSIRWAGAEGF